MAKQHHTIQPIRGAPPSIEWLAVGALRIDQAYQRAIDAPTSQRLIENIACDWDWGLFGILTVSRRPDGGLYVMDGQHRLEAAKIRGDLPFLPAVVISINTLQEEAKFFVKANTERKGATTLDRFNARCISGDERALAVRALIEGAGLKVARSPYKLKDGEVGCVAVVERLLRRYGEKIISAALIDLAEAWPGQPIRVGNEMLPGLCLLLYAPPKEFDPDILIETLRSREQQHWFLNAHHFDYDRDSIWPDEVFRDLILAAYLEYCSASLTAA